VHRISVGRHYVILFSYIVALWFSVKVIQTEFLELDILAYCRVDKLNLAESSQELAYAYSSI